jgi:hypothetical protein
VKKIYGKLKKKAEPQKRHTHATSAGIEDALAVAIDIIHEYERTQEYVVSRIKKLMQILQEVRKGPHAYDQEKPAGLRITIKRR